MDAQGGGDEGSPVGVRPTTSYLPEIESLRGIAIGLVYAVHLDHLLYSPFAVREPCTSIWYAFVRAGQSGVDLFFVLSGFLLSLPFLTEAAGGPAVRTGRYFHRRALRILPLYVLAVVIATVLSARAVRDLVHAVPYLFFLNAFPDLTTSLQPYSNVWWSLATEVHFYLLLPLLPFCLRSRTGRYGAGALLLAYALAYAAFAAGLWAMPTYMSQRKLDQSIFGRAPLFLVGILVASTYRTFGAHIRARSHALPWLRAGGADIALLAIVVGLGVLLRWTVAIGWLRLDLPPYHAWHVLEALCWGAVLILVLLAPLKLKPLLCNRFLAWVGLISYSLYLIHYPLLVYAMLGLYRAGLWNGAGWTPRAVLIAVPLTAVCLGLSALSYRYIERPFLARKARIDG